MISNILFAVVLCVANDLSLKKYLGFRNELRLTYAMPLLSSAIMALAAAGVYYGLHTLTKQVFLPLVLAIIIAVVIYLVAYVIFTRTTEKQMLTFPMGGKLVRILKILRVF